MPILIKCECGKAYKVPEERAGQKIRCKECGSGIPIPAAVRTAEPKEWNDDWNEDNAVDESAPAPRSPKPERKTKAERDDEFLPPVKRSLSSTSEAVQQAEEQTSQARNFGLGMLGTGLLIFILPFFGLQLRVAANMGPEGAMIVGGVLAVIGLISLVASTMITVKPARPKPSSRRGRAADDDDDEEDAAPAKVVNPGEKIAKIFLWTILIAMLSIPALILFVVMLGVVLIFWRIAIPLLVISLGLGIAGFIYWRRNRSGRSSRKRGGKRDDQDDEDESED